MSTRPDAASEDAGELRIYTEDMRGEAHTRHEILADTAAEPGGMARRRFLNLGIVATLETLVLVAATGAGEQLAARSQGEPDHDKITHLETTVLDAAKRRLFVGANNLNLLISSSQTTQQPAFDPWNLERNAHAQTLAITIETTPGLRTNTAAAFRYACDALRQRRLNTSTPHSETGLDISDNFVALGLAYNPPDVSSVALPYGFYPKALNKAQAFLANINANLAPTVQDAQDNARLIDALTQQFAKAQNLDPAFIATITDSVAGHSNDMAGVALANACNALNLALTNTAIALGVPVQKKS